MLLEGGGGLDSWRKRRRNTPGEEVVLLVEEEGRSWRRKGAVEGMEVREGLRLSVLWP